MCDGMQKTGDVTMTDAAFRIAWRPGLPVLTEQDHADWQAWRHNRALELQRARRRKLRRIDFYPCEAAAAVIDELRAPRVGGDASSIINRIIAEWYAHGSGIK
jgi:hypothetical protein